MKKRTKSFWMIIVLLLMLSNVAFAGQWRFPVGISFVSGFHNVVSVYKDNLRAQGYSVSDSYEVPVGLMFQPYYQFDNGLGVGGGFGPFMFLRAEGSGVSYDLYSMPVNLCVRYVLFPSKNISPYIRAGLSYNIAGGDFIRERNVGFLGGVGVEFFRQNKVGFGLEASFDSSSLKLERVGAGDKEVRPSEFIVSLFAVF